VPVAEGDDQAFAFVPDAGCRIRDILVDGGSVGAVPAWTFEDVFIDHVVSATFASDLVVNGSFEELDGASPKAWKTASFDRSGARFTTDTSAHSGKRSVAIASTNGADGAWTTIVPVRPFATYRLSGWIRT
jgi:predicted acylesterase/phospholipase RssA